MASPPGTSLDDACLPAVLPGGTVVTDIVDRRPNNAPRQRADVSSWRTPQIEIAEPERFVGAAPWVVLALGEPPFASDAHGRARRAWARLYRAASLRRQVSRARRLLGSHGYATVETVYWDKGHPLRIHGSRRPSVTSRHRFPRRAFVVGRAEADAPTLLDEVVARAEGVIGPLGDLVPLVRSGQLVILGQNHVLRTAIGAGTHRLARNFGRLEELYASSLPTAAKGLVPPPCAAGWVGDAQWTVEGRSSGATAERLTPSLGQEAVNFLEALHRLGQEAPPKLPSVDSVSIVPACSPADRRLLERLCEWADDRLIDVPSGWTHGDFYRGNLLIEDGRLSGVIDWDSSTPNGLPVIDYLHLYLESDPKAASAAWGRRIIERLVPWAARGGDARLRAHCDALNVHIDSERLLAFVVAYWAGRLGYQLRGYADRTSRSIWLEQNLHRVLPALATQCLGR